MPSREERLVTAAHVLSGVEGLYMAPEWMLYDLSQLYDVYGDGFEPAIESLRRAIEDVLAGRVSTSRLKYDLAQVRSYHFQSVVRQGQRADMRLAYVPHRDGIHVIGFGNRHLPDDFYQSIRDRA